MKLSIIDSLKKTFKSPLTYVGAAIVGGVSLLTKDYTWGILVPFFIPIFVLGLMRVLAQYGQKEIFNNIKKPSPNGPTLTAHHKIFSISNIFEAIDSRQTPHLLVKIQINSASEVIRLNERNGIEAENIMINMVENVIKKNFYHCMLFKVSYNAFIVVLNGKYAKHEENLVTFIDTHSPCKITINETTYYPNLLMGITPHNDHLGESFSRLEFALHKATLTSGKAYWYIGENSREFKKYRDKRLGLRLIRSAIDHSELGLYAQPIINLGSRQKTNRYEVLLRHYLNDTEVNSPLQILEYAEFNKISQDIDLYVINLLCKNFHHLNSSIDGGVDSISLNLTESAFTSPRFTGLLNGIITKHNIPKERLILEITETIANHNISEAIKTMEQFKTYGFKLALDDIGIGSSNFHSLRLFPVDYYKIDRSYNEEILERPEIKRFVQLIIDMAKDNGKIIIAEGIPDQETLELLTQMGADYSQSFLTGKPMEFIKAPKFNS